MAERDARSRLNEPSRGTAHPPHLDRLARKLRHGGGLTPEIWAALAALPVTIEALAAQHDILREGDRPTRCCILVKGFAHRHRVTPAGTRQITAFHLPGDVPDLQSLHLDVADHTLGTLGACTAAFIEHRHLRPLIRQHPSLADALWRDTLVEAAVFREWVVNVGRRNAYTRIAHLLCELMIRLDVVGLVEGRSCDLPLTQAVIGDATGLSTVHVNRSLQELRGDGLIALAGGKLVALDWPGLQAAGEFDPTYLHLRGGSALDDAPRPPSSRGRDANGSP